MVLNFPHNPIDGDVVGFSRFGANHGLLWFLDGFWITGNEEQ